EGPLTPAELAEVVRLYGLRQWVEQSYRQIKHELGWADFMVRADQAIRRHWHLVCCTFAFCWRQWFATRSSTGPAEDEASRGKNRRLALLAPSRPPRPRVAGSLDFPLALLARVVDGAPAARAPSAPHLGRQRPSSP